MFHGCKVDVLRFNVFDKPLEYRPFAGRDALFLLQLQLLHSLPASASGMLLWTWYSDMVQHFLFKYIYLWMLAPLVVLSLEPYQ